MKTMSEGLGTFLYLFGLAQGVGFTICWAMAAGRWKAKKLD